MRTTIYISLTLLLISFACEEGYIATLDNTATLELEGTWVIKKYTDKETDISQIVPDQLSSSIQFLNDGQIQVNTFCNSGKGKIEINYNNVQVTELSMTEIACPATWGDESQITDNLSGTYQIANDTLVIVSDHDTDLSLIQKN